MRLTLVAVVFSACMTTRVATPAPYGPVDQRARYAARPVVVAVRDQAAFNRGLQTALGLGLQPRSVDSQAGLFTVEITQFDDFGTLDAADGHQHYRRLSITAVVGKAEATVSPQVVECLGVSCGNVVVPELVEDEAALLKRIIEAISPPRRPATPENPAAEI